MARKSILRLKEDPLPGVSHGYSLGASDSVEIMDRIAGPIERILAWPFYAWREIERQVTSHALALQAKLDEMTRWQPQARSQFEEAAELADRHYRLGAVPMTTYVEMQTSYLDALEALLATEAEALEHRQQLELLVGRPLETLQQSTT